MRGDPESINPSPDLPLAAEQLAPLVYEELRRLAARKLAGEAPGQTLDATAEAMRRILVERARRRGRRKHGGGRARAALDPDALPAPDADPDADAELLALDGALTRLTERDPQAAELIKLRHFTGLTVAQ